MRTTLGCQPRWVVHVTHPNRPRRRTSRLFDPQLPDRDLPHAVVGYRPNRREAEAPEITMDVALATRSAA
jgi:hypothetical protein